MNFSFSRHSNPIVKNLLIINILLLLTTFVIESTYSLDLTRYLGLYYPASENFRPYQFITHMFMHGGLTHLFFNMFALWMFGKVLENVWGSKRFLFYYLVTGVGAAILHTLVIHFQISAIIDTANTFLNNPTPELFSAFIRKHVSQPSAQLIDFITDWEQNPSSYYLISFAKGYVNDMITMKTNIPTVGASGAVFGVLLAFGMMFPNVQLMLLFPPVPIKAKYFVTGYGLIELYLGITQPGSQVAHFAHLGGMLFGFFLIRYWNKNRIEFLE